MRTPEEILLEHNWGYHMTFVNKEETNVMDSRAAAKE